MNRRARQGSRIDRAARATLSAALLALSGCQPGANLPPLPPAPTGPYRLGSGDEVRVITFGDQTLTAQFRVDDSGTIAMPLLGPVRAAGLTTRGLTDEIDEQLRQKKLFSEPSVSVEVIAYRPIFVLGEVNRPGEFPYRPGMTLLSAVAIAGGFTYRAFEDYASVTRKTGAKPVESKAGRDALIEPGDVIQVFERKF